VGVEGWVCRASLAFSVEQMYGIDQRRQIAHGRAAVTTHHDDGTTSKPFANASASRNRTAKVHKNVAIHCSVHSPSTPVPHHVANHAGTCKRPPQTNQHLDAPTLHTLTYIDACLHADSLHAGAVRHSICPSQRLQDTTGEWASICARVRGQHARRCSYCMG
jgi:hypothetical protein